MARYKAIDTSPRFLAVDLEKQLLPGSFLNMLCITCSTMNSTYPCSRPAAATTSVAPRPTFIAACCVRTTSPAPQG